MATEAESDRRHFYPSFDTLLLSDFPNFSDLIDPKDTFLSNGIDEIACEGEQDEEEIGPILLQEDLDPNVDLKKSVDLISMQDMDDFCSSLENISSKYSSAILMADQETNNAKEEAEGEEEEGEEREDEGEHDQMTFKLKLKQKNPAFIHDFLCGKEESDDHDGLLSSGNIGGRLIMKNTQTDHEGEEEEEEEEGSNHIMASNDVLCHMESPQNSGKPTSFTPLTVTTSNCHSSIATTMITDSGNATVTSNGTSGITDAITTNAINGSGGDGSSLFHMVGLNEDGKAKKSSMDRSCDGSLLSMIDSSSSSSTSSSSSSSSSHEDTLQAIQSMDMNNHASAPHPNLRMLITDPLIVASSDPCHASNVSAQDVHPYIPTMQRSQSSHSLGQLRASSMYLGSFPEEGSVPPILEMQVSDFPSVNRFPPYPTSTNSTLIVEGTPVRRVFSTGDLQAFNGMTICYGGTNPCHSEYSNSEEILGSKIGQYTLEERKERLHRYRQKRNERNFSKKIKYACRKTLADSRPRVRGRFARTLDDSGELLLKENGVSRDEDYDERYRTRVFNGNYNMAKNNEAKLWKSTRMNFVMEHGV